MRTEDLIRAIAADAGRPRALGPTLALVLLACVVLVAAVFLPTAGPRPDLAAATMHLRVLVKQAFPILLAVAAFGTALRLARPGEVPGGWAAALGLVPLLLLAAVAGELMALPAPARMPTLMGQSSRQCVPFIVAMGLPPLAGALWALGRGASTRPGLSGAVAGLLAGGAAAAVYAVHCTEDSPLFYAVWYVLAILLLAALGALLGPRLLRW